MENRTIVLENASKMTIGLLDSQGRVYKLHAGEKRRISSSTLQDIVDNNGSKQILALGYVKVGGAMKSELLEMGLSEEEIRVFAKDLIEEVKEVKVEEEVKEIVKEEIAKEEVVEEAKVAKAPAKKPVKKAPVKKAAE